MGRRMLPYHDPIEALLRLPPVERPVDGFDDHERRVVSVLRSRAAAQHLWDAVCRNLQHYRPSVLTLEQTEMQAMAEASGAPLANVEATWPLVLSALRELDISRALVRAGAAATIAVETGTFQSLVERGTRPYFDKYEPNTALGQRLGNEQPGDGYKYRGRGFIQLTGKSNYKRYGARLGLDLVGQPDLALEPEHAARVFALYFRIENVALACEAEDWLRVRRRVNGGYRGWPLFARVLRALLPSTPIPTPPDGAVL